MIPEWNATRRHYETHLRELLQAESANASLHLRFLCTFGLGFALFNAAKAATIFSATTAAVTGGGAGEGGSGFGF